MSSKHSKMRSALQSMRTRLVVPDRTEPRGSATRPSPSAATQHTAGDESFAALLCAEADGIKPIDAGGRVELERPKPPPAKRSRPAPRQHASDSNQSSRDESSDCWQDEPPLRAKPGSRIEHTLSHEASPHPLAPLSGTEADPPVPSLNQLAARHCDTELFRVAVGEVKPVDTRNRSHAVDCKPKPQPLPRNTYEDEQAALQEALDGPITLIDQLDIGDEAVFLRHGVPRRVLPELRRGRWAVQAYLDLHGMTRDQARSALVAFLNTCLRRGHRCVRIIHGKGLGSPDGLSVLKQLSPGWLAQREEILAFCQAAPNQGGAGALVVLLRGSSRR